MRRLFCVLLICVLLAGCTGETKAEKTVFAMDTVMDLRIWGRNADKAAETVASLLAALEKTWSVTGEESVIARLNRGSMELTEAERAVIEGAEALSARTGGAFDPRLGQLSAVWGFYDGANQKEGFVLPTENGITAALAAKLWDLGAVIKGYAGELAVGELKKLDVSYGILNLGGNVQTYGTKPDGSPWQIGIQNPRGGDSIGIVSVDGTCAIVTSGDYQRYFERDGIRYHHVLDPKTGCPADSGLTSVTVICRDGMTADALSTALFVMGLEAGTEFWRQSDDFEAVFILTDGSIYATEGTKLSGCEFEVICREK
ncbi:MAG: FAD:protein FMN transferase [Oscillospiraceae bacterium]|nr:FAD:protein FMN transferase [Oscillospiraceae bacterium]